MSRILNILDELAATSSRLDKEAILKREHDNHLLKKVIVYALNPYLNFYVRNYEYDARGKASVDTAFPVLDMLSARKVTGNAARDMLEKVSLKMSEEDAEVLWRIIQGDLRCGVSEATVNKIWKGLIPTFDVMLAHKDISGIKYPAYAQTKLDGARCHLYYDGDQVVAYARSGKVFELHNALVDSAKILMLPGETWDGELLFYKDGKPLDRKTSNGLANKANKGTITPKDATSVRFVAWDIVDFSSTIPYKNRWADLAKRFLKTETVAERILLVSTKIVANEKEAQAFFEKQINAGEEGAILKNMDSLWVPKRSKDLGKMKAENEADLKIIGVEEGSGKYKGMLGAFLCETRDGKIQVSVGSGFSDEQRDDYFTENMIDSIIAVRYNAKITKKGGGKDSLFLPRFIEVRFDKKRANSSDELV
jgi:hypothetical protein